MKTIAEKIAELSVKRSAAIASMTALVEKADSEERELVESEVTEFEGFKAEIKGFDASIQRNEDLEELQKEKAVPVAAPSIEVMPVVIETIQKDLEPGLAMIRYAKALANANNDYTKAGHMASHHYKDTPMIGKALSARGMGMPSSLEKAVQVPALTTDLPWAGELIYMDNLESQFIELLRPETVIGQLSGMVQIPFNVRIPNQVSGLTSAGWVGEAQQKPVGQAAYGSTTFPWAKMALITSYSDEMLRFSSPSIDTLLRDDLVKTLTQFTDDEFLSDNPAVGDLSPSGIRDGITSVPSTGITVAAVTNDFNAALLHYATNNLGTDSLICIMSTRTEQNLLSLRTTQDLFAFKAEMLGGTIMGVPYITSNNVPTNLGLGFDETYILFIKQNEIFWAEEGFAIDTSKEASIQMSDVVGGEFDVGPPVLQAPSAVSAWQNNLTFLRCERYMYWQHRRVLGMYEITAVLY